MPQLVLLCLVLLGLGVSVAAGEPDTRRPNIVLMMADDMGLGDTSAFQDFTGNSDADQVHTPNMDRLARIGVRFTDAHTPCSRCTTTRYGLLTGRYPWRNRMKHWVLFGVQGDPLIEADRPTIGSLLQQQGYRTGLVGKWHVGLRYRQSDGQPAAGWDDADLKQPMFDTPLDHGFDYCRFTSRSHGTSGPSAGNKKKPNGPQQSVGPGHIHGRQIVGATGTGKELVKDGPNAYVLSELGGRHLQHAVDFMSDHLADEQTSAQPFFLYYPSNSNHGPYTPDSVVNGVPVAGASRSVDGQPMDVRSDFIYENDVVLGQLVDYLERTEDPRNDGHKLIENTIVIFTSDNGAERKAKTATGPFRSNKGSVYEGGHRVPFIVAWQAGGVGDGDESTDGRTDETLIGLHDMYATFAEIVNAPLPDVSSGEKGAEDSMSVLAAWSGERIENRVMFFNDHNEAEDHAVVALRWDDPTVGGQTISGKWKLFFDQQLVRTGIANPFELYNLSTDPQELSNLLGSQELQPLVEHLTHAALHHRTAGGHRLQPLAPEQRFMLDWRADGPQHDVRLTRIDMRSLFEAADGAGISIDLGDLSTAKLQVAVAARRDGGEAAGKFNVNPNGLGAEGGKVAQVDDGEAILIQFDQDVIVESVAVVAGNGTCGGFYRVGDRAPLAIYCVDGDIDAQDQSGVLSDIGVLKARQILRLDSSPHLGVEAQGRWRLGALTFRKL
jgi:arylsulfatase A